MPCILQFRLLNYSFVVFKVYIINVFPGGEQGPEGLAGIPGSPGQNGALFILMILKNKKRQWTLIC